MSLTYPEWFQPVMPERNDCVLGPLLDCGNSEHPDRVFALFENGTSWSYADTWRNTRSWAAGLQELGVKAGDAVSVWLPNRPEILNAWFSANYIGATYAPINTAYRGELLSHVIHNAGAKILIGHSELLPRLIGADLGQIEQIVCIGDLPDIDLGVPINSADILDADPNSLQAIPDVMPWDTMAIIYTSGTTGPSKGVRCSYFHFYNVGILAVGFIKTDERCFVNMPLFHIGAAGGTFGALARHASIGVVDGFSTSKFWDQIRSMNCAVMCGLVGSTVAFLSKREPAADDKDNPLRRVIVAPVNEQVIALAKRHDFGYFTGYGMTEAPMPLISEVDTTMSGGYCGRPRDGVECRVVDGNDIEVVAGGTGELIVRSDHPWSMNHGYINMPEATVAAWRNGWFHTGDAFRCDEHGNFYFVDRLKDAIRRRGENISSLEVEKAVLEYPQVLDVAAIPVPAEHDEDEVMIVVESQPGTTVDPVALTEFLVVRMAHFMVPRYIRMMPSLPKTPTNKVQKPLLKSEGVTADTWDREAAGIVLKRIRLD
jgi:crotonobetaine/carnitine-CoA ligase